MFKTDKVGPTSKPFFSSRNVRGFLSRFVSKKTYGPSDNDYGPKSVSRPYPMKVSAVGETVSGAGRNKSSRKLESVAPQGYTDGAISRSTPPGYPGAAPSAAVEHIPPRRESSSLVGAGILSRAGSGSIKNTTVPAAAESAQVSSSAHRGTGEAKAAASAAVAPVTTAPAAKAPVCDKCDGKHETDSCPYYKKARDSHPDAQKSTKRLGGISNLPGALLKNARVVRQPGDGSCLFHSLSYGLRDGSNASTLRRQICAFMVDNPTVRIADTPLADWVKWDSGGSSVSAYARKMSSSAWGGGIEMATVSKMKGVNVHVYEQTYGGFKRISAFDHEESPEAKPTVRVLYGGGVHYDALVAS